MYKQCLELLRWACCCCGLTFTISLFHKHLQELSLPGLDLGKIIPGNLCCLHYLLSLKELAAESFEVYPSPLSKTNRLSSLTSISAHPASACVNKQEKESSPPEMCEKGFRDSFSFGIMDCTGYFHSECLCGYRYIADHIDQLQKNVHVQYLKTFLNIFYGPHNLFMCFPKNWCWSEVWAWVPLFL